MRISIVSSAYPLRGGIAQYTALLYAHLCKHGHEVKVVTFKRQYPTLFFPGKTQMEKSKDESVRIPSCVILDSVAQHTWFRAAKKIREYQPDLLLFNYWMPFFAPCFGTIARLVKRRHEVKAGYICHNVIPHERRFGDNVLTRWALRVADFFVVQSKTVENDLLSLLPTAKYQHIPHPLYDVYGELLEKQVARDKLAIHSDKVLLFFGYIRAYKGLHLLIHAMPEILRKVTTKLLVVGEFYEDQDKYRTLIDDLGLTSHVIIEANFVPNEQVHQYFSAADVVVLPYKSATQSGIVQIAYHFNKPCIVTNVGGLAEVVLQNETGFVVEPDDPVAIANAVVRFYTENCEIRFAAAINREKHKYSWDKLVDAIIDLSQ